MKKLLIIIRSLLLRISGSLTFLLGATIVLFTSLFAKEKILERTIRFLSKSVLFMLAIRTKITGTNNLPENKHYVIMMNHVNFLDQFLFFKIFPGRAKGIEEESHFKWPVYGWILKRSKQIPMSRKNPRKARESLIKAINILREKTFSICILPEGTRTRDGKLGSFKKGGFLMAIESGLDILPIIQKGSYNINKRGSWLINPGKIECIIENPIPVKNFSKENISDLISKTRDVFLKHLP